jgi:hypothetical protein
LAYGEALPSGADLFWNRRLVSEDPDSNRDGLTVTLRRTKTDQEGQDRKLGPYGANPETCPVQVLQVWLEQSDIDAEVEEQPRRAPDRHCPGEGSTPTSCDRS